MHCTSLLRDDDAASPVLGIVLMVTVTVVVAAAIGTFALGVSERTGVAAPDAEFSVEYDDPTLEVVHAGGETLDAEHLRVVSEVETVEWGDGTVGPGDSRTLDRTAGEFRRGGTVRVVWTTDRTSATLRTYEVGG